MNGVFDRLSVCNGERRLPSRSRVRRCWSGVNDVLMFYSSWEILCICVSQYRSCLTRCILVLSCLWGRCGYRSPDFEVAASGDVFRVWLCAG